MSKRNRHPVDELADVRAEIKQLQGRESDLRDELLANGADLVGGEYYARIESGTQRRLDRRSLEARFGKTAVDECCKEIETVQIRLAHREAED